MEENIDLIKLILFIKPNHYWMIISECWIAYYTAGYITLLVNVYSFSSYLHGLWTFVAFLQIKINIIPRSNLKLSCAKLSHLVR